MKQKQCNANRSRHSSMGRSTRRDGSVILVVLIVLVLVGMLGMQTLQTLGIIRRGGMERAKIRQAREVAELARGMDWSKQAEEKNPVSEIFLEIPTGFEAQSPLATAAVSRQRDESATESTTESTSTARIIVRYPANEAGELTTTLEIKDENKAE